MYYYQIQDVSGTIIKEPETAYDTGDLAADAAKDELATMYMPSYPVEVRIYDGPPNDLQRYCSSTYYLSEEDVRQHALRRIEEANRQEFINILADAQKESDYLSSQFSLGYMTPLDYARHQDTVWAKALFDIESKG